MSTTNTNPTGTGAAPTGNQAIPDKAIDLIELLIILTRRKKLIVRVTVAAAILAAAVSLLLPNRYTATTKILPPQQNQSLSSTLAGQLGPLGALAGASQSLGLKNPNEIYVTMLKSHTVQDALVQRFNLAGVYRDHTISDARAELDKASSIALNPKDDVIAISVEDKDSKRAAILANAYIEELRKLTQTLAVTEAAQRRMFFEQQLQQAKNQLADAEQALKQTEQTTGLIQLDSQAKAIIDSLVKLKAEIAVKEITLRAMRSYATEQNPGIVREEQELAGMRSQLSALENQSGGGEDVQLATGKVPEAGLEYVRKAREVKYYETIFEMLARQFEAAKLDESRSAAVIQVLDPALEPDRKSSPNRLQIVLITALFGFLGSLLYVLIAGTVYRMGEDSGTNARFNELKAVAFPRGR